MRVYRNGAVVGSTTDSWNPNGTQRRDIILETTADSGGADKFIVDNIKIWNYAKTDFSDRFAESPVCAPWLSTAPAYGTVPANSSLLIEVTLDATNMQPGTYTAQIIIESNDPVAPSVAVPVTMTVLPFTPNDNFADATVLSGTDVTQSVNVTWATTEPEEPLNTISMLAVVDFRIN